jgi:hypothetical protein
MLSAQFLAEVCGKLRAAISAGNPYKNGPNGPRPFGGMNVLFIGDAYQFDPPEGAANLNTKRNRLKQIIPEGSYNFYKTVPDKQNPPLEQQPMFMISL